MNEKLMTKYNQKNEMVPNSLGSRLVNAERLLEILFEPESRPSIRWVRMQQKTKTIPFFKIGHLVYFDPAEVKEALRVKPEPQIMGRWKTETGGTDPQGCSALNTLKAEANRLRSKK